MTLTKFQKKIIKKILKFSPAQIEYSLKILIENILEEFFQGIGIKINYYEINFYINSNEYSTEKILTERKKVYELITLIYFLLEEKYLECIPTNIKNEFCYAVSSDKINNKKCIVPMGENIVNMVYNNLHAYFYISPLLVEFKRNFYTDLERINLKYTLIAIISSGIISFVGIISQIYTARYIDTTIIFRNNNEFKEILNIKKLDLLNEKLKGSEVYLKLEIFNLEFEKILDINEYDLFLNEKFNNFKIDLKLEKFNLEDN